jgi:hypothetical protein
VDSGAYIIEITPQDTLSNLRGKSFAVMKVTTATALVALLAPLQISAASLPLFGQSPLNAFEGENFPVEGENPLEYCSDPSSNILEILSVDLSPNPPVP